MSALAASVVKRRAKYVSMSWQHFRSCWAEFDKHKGAFRQVQQLRLFSDHHFVHRHFTSEDIKTRMRLVCCKPHALYSRNRLFINWGFM